MSPRVHVRTALVALACVVGFTGAAAPAHADGIMPLMKRLTSADTYDLQHADSRSNTGTVDPTVKSQFTTRFQALTMFESPDWATSWLPRQWHQNAWMYRKATSYLASHNVHIDYPQYFVKLKGTTDFASIDWDCNATRGCTQPIFDVTNAAARTFWLYGPDGKVNATSTCQSRLGIQSDGVLDKLVCGYKGVWLDDVLPDLLEGSYPSAPTAVANLRTGAVVPTSGLGTIFPYTSAQWAAGLATMLEQLRAGINTLKSQGLIPSTGGKVAINYKWSSFGFSLSSRTGANPTIAATSPAGRIIKAADLVELESGWIDNGLVAGPVSQDWTFMRRRQFVQQVHALGSRVLEEKTNSADVDEWGSKSCLRDLQTQDASRLSAHRTTAAYNFGASLLDWVPGDWVGDICEYHTGGPGQFGGQWLGYSWITPSNLGAVKGAWYYNGGSQIQRRDFANGYVLVSPPGTPTTTVTFPNNQLRGITFDHWGNLSRQNKSSVTLTQRQAVFVRWAPY